MKKRLKSILKTKQMSLEKKMSVDPDYADIICIGIKEIGKEPKLYHKQKI